MAMVEVARFVDLIEAQAAAAALRSCGIPVLVQNEHWGQTAFHMQMAMGGFPVWVPAKEADAARTFIREARGSHRQVEDDDLDHNPVGAGWGIASFLGVWLAPTIGWFVLGLRRRRPESAWLYPFATLTAVVVVAIVITVIVSAIKTFVDVADPNAPTCYWTPSQRSDCP